jgi:hypothetical protein
MPHKASRKPENFVQIHALLAVLGICLLCLWVAWRLGGFELITTVRTGGAEVRVPDTFAKVDHPFHATRAATLLDSLQDGEILRWIGNHQGGYPAEFYPLGVAWLDVGLWALLVGSVPIIAVHKLAVIVIFLLPAIAFWIIARGDRLNPWIAFLAMAIHVAIPGDWTNGGYRELVDWGLVTNVGGATLSLIACASMARSVQDGHRSMTALAALATAAAVYTNPRSLLAIAITAGAIVVTTVFFQDPDRPAGPVRSLRRVAVIAAVSMLLAAPLVIPLIRYRHLYDFVHYEGYATLKEYWDSTVTAVSLPVLLLSVAGVILTFAFQRHAIARSFAVALVSYALMTGALSNLASLESVIDQLETPRLMPFQRLVMIYLAAYAVAAMLELAIRYFRVGRARVVASGALGLAGILVIYLMLGSDWNPPAIFTTPPIETTALPEFQEYRNAVEIADEIAPQGTAILVIGNRLDSQSWWHQQLWGPLESDAPFFYDDWLWYWHEDHDGPYNYRNGHSYLDPERAITSDYFQTHGIGAVVVTNVNVRNTVDPRTAAQTNPALLLERGIGEWDIYRVAAPMSIVTNGNDQPTSLSIDNHQIKATFADADGAVTIRRNWFPRWVATADGQDVPVMRAENGYMQVTVPEGTRSLDLRYSVTGVDWLARGGVVAGIVSVIGILLRLDRRRLRRRTTSTRDAEAAVTG